MIITIDGPSGSGKGTMALLLAQKLKFQILDSGALYRLVALVAIKKAIEFDDEVGLAKIASNLNVSFIPDAALRIVKVMLDGIDVTNSVRNEKTAALASKVASIPEVRAALLQRQRDFAKNANLVADGRDMGTVVFPDADYKFYLNASAKERAIRRAKQLKSNEDNASIRALQDQIEARDRRDMNRATAPLKLAPDSIELDTTGMSIEAVLEKMLGIIKL